MGKDAHKKYVHVCPCPDAYRGIHRGENDEKLGEIYANECKKTIDEATSNGRKVNFLRFLICLLEY